MNIFFIVTSIAFLIWAVRNILFWVALLQDKEYRRDRLLVHVKETIQGRQILISPWNIVKWLLFFFYIVVIFQDSLTTDYQIAIGSFFIGQALFVLRDVFLHRIKRPTFTVKALLLSLLSFAFVLLLLVNPLINIFAWIIVMDRILPLIVGLFVFIFAFPTEIYRDVKIMQARNKMRKYPKILVIAISGSYGKTSTKEYIAQVLATKYTVVKTPASNNTPIGIANTILTKINAATDIFVVEMGAYKKGEIAELCRIVKPNISVTTSVSDQHISLYGSLENVFASEAELLHALAKDGLALFNGNNNNAVTLSEQTTREKVLYKWFDKRPTEHVDVGAYRLKATPDGLSFTAILNNREFICKTKLLGPHVIENILPAIYLGHYLKLTVEEIVSAIAHLVAPSHTLTKIKLANGIIGIDDTFNVSPESALAAMDYIALYKKKKIFILSPLTELGKNAKERYKALGEKASHTCDYVFLLSKNYAKDFLQSAANNKNCMIEISRPEGIAKKIQTIVHKGDVILFEGKESKMVLKKL